MSSRKPNWKKSNDMDMYLEKAMRKTSLVPDVATGRNSRTCFVCGCPNSATFMVRTKPNGSSEPHFPFLENHEPPVGCEVPSRSEGKVAACNLCYSFLVSQWVRLYLFLLNNELKKLSFKIL